MTRIIPWNPAADEFSGPGLRRARATESRRAGKKDTTFQWAATGTQCALAFGLTNLLIGDKMLHRDSLFRRREEQGALFRGREEPGSKTSASAGTNAAPAAAPPPATSTQAVPTAQAAVNPSSDTARGEERKEAKLIVGPDIKMKGVEIADCDTLVVEGRIEATLDARVLQIASNGVFQGTVAVDVAEIHGSVEGELTVRKQLILHATGRVSGKIRYAKIKVEEGAELSGEIGLLDSGAGARLARPAARVANPAG
jgi:cytoskeletal protein CcmA (bactofilin family)